VCGKGKWNPDVQMCGGGEITTLARWAHVSLISSFVGEWETGKEIEGRRSDNWPGETEGTRRGGQNLVALGSQAESSYELVQHRCHRNGVHQRWVHHDAGTSIPYVVELAEDVSNAVPGRCDGLQTSDNVAVWILEDDISVVGRAGAPPVLITVRSVEDSPSVSSSVLSHKVSHRDYGLSNGRTSKAAVGGPLEFGNSFLLGGTNGAPERGYALTTTAGIGLESVHNAP